MNENSIKNFGTGRAIALVMGGAVYLGVVILFLAFYENLMTDQFTGLLKVFARVGAFLVSANAIALPVALHFWTVTKGHKMVAVLFYAGDILIMGLNVLAAANLGTASGWLAEYQQYAPATIVYVLTGWAVLYMTDPGQRALVNMSEAITSAQVEIVNRAKEFVQSDDGIARIVEPFAGKLAGRIFNERSLLGVQRGVTIENESDTNLEDVVGRIVSELQKVTPTLAVSGGNGHTKKQKVEVGKTDFPFDRNGHES